MDDSNTVHELSVQERYFNYIRDGVKTIEGRAGKVDPTKGINENYKKGQSVYKAGDTMRFTISGVDKETGDKETCDKNVLLCTISEVKFFITFEDMLRESGIDKCLPGIKSMEEGVHIYRSFPGYAEREEKYGVVGIHVKRCSDF